MSRCFCMIDTLDTIPDRLVINIQTRNNVEQAVAENINPKLTHEQRVEHAKTEHADYIDRVWVHNFGLKFELEIHVESGELFYNNKQIENKSTWKQVKQYEYVDEYNSWCSGTDKQFSDWYSHGVFYYIQKKYHIMNPPGVDHHINTHIKTTYFTPAEGFFMRTSSKCCDVGVRPLNHQSVWDTWTGALVRQSDDNKRDHLKHVV